MTDPNLRERVCRKVGIEPLAPVESEFGPWTGKMLEWLRPYNIDIIGVVLRNGAEAWQVSYSTNRHMNGFIDGSFLKALCLAIDAVEVTG